MTVDEETMLREMMNRAPFEDVAEARSVLRAVLTALRSGLPDHEAALLADDLGGTASEPHAWAKPLRSGAYHGRLTPEELYRLVAWHEDRRLSMALEHAQIVCAALASLVSEATLQRLFHQLPELGELFEKPLPPDPPYGPQRVRPAAAPEHTLAAGRPGSRHPLSEARPTSSRPLSAARPELAHAHSVARSDDPHADTKLSSSIGLTQEREFESLARARRNPP